MRRHLGAVALIALLSACVAVMLWAFVIDYRDDSHQCGFVGVPGKGGMYVCRETK